MVVYYPMYSSLYYAHNYIEKLNYESKSSKHSTLNKRDVEKAIKDAVKDINNKPNYPPKSNYKNSDFMNRNYYDYAPTITLYRQARLIEVFLRVYQEALDSENLEKSNIIAEKAKQHEIGEAKDSPISQMQRNTRLLKAWGIYVGILGEAAMGGTPAAVKAYLVAAAAKGAIFPIAGAIFLPFLKAAASLLAVYMIIKVSTVAYDH